MRIERIYNSDRKHEGRAYMAITSIKSEAEIEAVCAILDKKWEAENTQYAEFSEDEWCLSYVIDLYDLKGFKKDYREAKKEVN